MSKLELICCALALALLPASAGAADLSFDRWDVDGSGGVERQEFALGMGTLGVYQRWDSDHDGMLTDEEFRARPPAAMEEVDADVWTAWNLNDDPVLDEEEVGGGYFSRFDGDGDGAIGPSEWPAFRAYAEQQGWTGG